MLSVASGAYTALFTGLTAAFGGVVAFVMYMGYRHGRQQAGLRRPIRASHEKYWHPDDLKVYELPQAIVDRRSKQLVMMRFSNRTDEDIRWSIDEKRTRLFGTSVRGSRLAVEDPGAIETRRHDGTSVGLVFVFEDDALFKRFGDENPGKNLNKLPKRFWVRVRGLQTACLIQPTGAQPETGELPTQWAPDHIEKPPCPADSNSDLK